MAAISAYTHPAHLEEKHHHSVFYDAVTIEQRASFHSSVPADESCGQHAGKPIQKALLLKRAREQYTLVDDHEIPSLLNKDEVLIKVIYFKESTYSASIQLTVYRSKPSG
jgi:hypothetical protein